MATLTIRVPDAHRDRLASMAAQRGVSVNKLMEELSIRALTEHDTEMRLGLTYESAESGSSRIRFWSDARPNGPRLRSGGDNPGRQDVQRGIDIPIGDQAAAHAAGGLRLARMVPGAAPAALLRRVLRVHFYELSTGPSCLVIPSSRLFRVAISRLLGMHVDSMR